MRISDWSSDVCSSDLLHPAFQHVRENQQIQQRRQDGRGNGLKSHLPETRELFAQQGGKARAHVVAGLDGGCAAHAVTPRYSSSWSIGSASFRESVCQYV